MTSTAKPDLVTIRATKPITPIDDVNADLAALIAIDSRLKAVLDKVVEVALRLQPSGFAGIAHIVVGQLLSVASARAISSRLNALVTPLTASEFLRVDDSALLKCGLSNAKLRTLTGLAQAQVAGQLDFNHLAQLSVTDATAELCQYKGIGPWTAQVYLLFCVGHRDIFPAGDLALQKAVAHAFDLDSKPDAKALAQIASQWSPYQGSAARLFWAYFAYLKQREGVI
ncbi:DNA-3-methyladenine glycosylase 2 family protein [Gammaproteobacteria bacterium AS21]